MKRVSDDQKHIDYIADSANLGIRIFERNAFAITTDGTAAWVQRGAPYEIPIDDNALELHNFSRWKSVHSIAIAFAKLSTQEKSEAKAILFRRKSFRDAVEEKWLLALGCLRVKYFIASPASPAETRPCVQV